MSWKDQGRKEHGWFGDGTAPGDDKSGDARMFGPDGLDQRITAVVYGALASLPHALRTRAMSQLDARALALVGELMTAWLRAARLDPTSFAEHFFGRGPDDPVVAKLRDAAWATALATNHAELRDAGGQLAGAMQIVGLDRWARFLANAQERTREPGTVAAVATSQPLPPRPGILAAAQEKASEPGTGTAVAASQPLPPRHGMDAIRPVYPLETLLLIGAAGMGGVAGAVRIGGRAALKLILPEARPSGSTIAPLDAEEGTGAETPSITFPDYKPSEPTPPLRPLKLNEGDQNKHIPGKNNYIPGRSTLTADSETLLKRFAGKGQQVGRIPVGQAGSKKKFDAGVTIGISNARPGPSGPTTREIIHYSEEGAHIVPARPGS